MDIAGPIAAFMIFAVLGACIILPIWLRHRLFYKQIDTVARAIEKGIDPVEIKRCLALPQQAGDVNGNWKAGVILIWLGLAAFVLGLPAAMPGPNQPGNAGWPLILLAVVLGIILLRIHKAVVGGVVKTGQRQVDAPAGAAGQSAPVATGQAPRDSSPGSDNG